MKFKLNPNSPLPLYLQLEKEIKKRILEGNLKKLQRLPTERELAKACKVERRTISKAFNRLVEENLLCRVQGKGTFVIGPDLKEAKALIDTVKGRKKKQKTDKLGLLFPCGFVYMPDDFYYTEVLMGAREEIVSANRDLLTMGPCWRDHTSSYNKLIQNQDIDGILIMAPLNSKKTLIELSKVGVPCMLISMTTDSNISYVDADNVEGAFEAIQYLIRLNHSRIAIITLKDKWGTNSRDRFKGYKMALEKNGLNFNEKMVVYTKNKYEEDGYVAASKIVEMKPVPTAVFVLGYWLTIGAINAIKVKGLRIPEDISVIGFDDPSTGLTVEPPLTTVRQPFYDMGRIAARNLIEIVGKRNPQPKKIVLKTELVIRNSCSERRNYE